MFLLATGSIAVLAGCNKTPTDSNSPATSTSPATSGTSKVPAASNPTTTSSNSSVTSNPTTTSSNSSVTSNPTTASTPSAASNSTTGANITKAEAALKNIYTQQIGVPIESVTCPENANFKPGSTFECEAKAQGVNFGIQVNMENEQGKFNTKVKGLLLNLSKIEEKLQATLKEKAGTDVTADCGGKLRAAKTGDTFTCQLKNKEGQTRNVQITVKNEKGELNVKL